jgi:predicted nucleotide-binding protein
MVFYHVRITTQGDTHDETKLDLSEPMLEKNFLAPYRAGEPITVNGRSIPCDRIVRIRVSATNEPASQLLQVVRDERLNSRVAVIGGPSDEWLVADRGTDVTDHYITGPAGRMGEVQSPGVLNTGTLNAGRARGPDDNRSVFLVAGRDNALVSAVTTFIRALGIRVVEWEHAVARVGVGNPYIGEVVIAGMNMAYLTLVLITPDDVVRLRTDLVRDGDATEELEYVGQARPNVFYEAGVADTLGKQRTIILEVGRVKPFSDISGRHIVKFDGTAAMRHALASRMKNLGLDVDTSGQGWLTAGDIEGAIRDARAALEAHMNEPA